MQKDAGMKTIRKQYVAGFLLLLMAALFTGCNSSKETIVLAAASSLETCLSEQLLPLFEEQYPDIKVVATYDASGKLETQIESGAEVDVFFSAATGQMATLTEQGLIAPDSVVPLLENKLVLIVPSGAKTITDFYTLNKLETIAIGDPESVPAGQYAKEALTYTGCWEDVFVKASLGTNVTEVLNWVAEGSAEAGIVYATDAAQTNKVTVVAEAPEGSVQPILYPVGMVNASEHKESAQKFLDFLQSEEALAIFEANGFTKG